MRTSLWAHLWANFITNTNIMHTPSSQTVDKRLFSGTSESRLKLSHTLSSVGSYSPPVCPSHAYQLLCPQQGTSLCPDGLLLLLNARELSDRREGKNYSLQHTINKWYLIILHKWWLSWMLCQWIQSNSIPNLLLEMKPHKYSLQHTINKWKKLRLITGLSTPFSSTPVLSTTQNCVFHEILVL